MNVIIPDYLKILKERSKISRVYSKHQLTGLILSQILDDETHKALYIRLAKRGDSERLMTLAKDVAEKRSVENRGAYFMKLAKEKGLLNIRHVAHKRRE